MYNNRMDITAFVGEITLVSIIMIGIGSAPILLQLLQPVEAKVSMQYVTGIYSGPRASIAVNENNIYLTWWDNTIGNNEVYFVKVMIVAKTLIHQLI